MFESFEFEVGSWKLEGWKCILHNRSESLANNDKFQGFYRTRIKVKLFLIIIVFSYCYLWINFN